MYICYLETVFLLSFKNVTTNVSVSVIWNQIFEEFEYYALFYKLNRFFRLAQHAESNSAHLQVLANQARIKEFVKRGRDHFSKFSLRVAKKSISISFIYSRGQEFACMLLAYSYEHIGRQHTCPRLYIDLMICYKSFSLDRMTE